jgi:hypothetical protein
MWYMETMIVNLGISLLSWQEQIVCMHNIVIRLNTSSAPVLNQWYKQSTQLQLNT